MIHPTSINSNETISSNGEGFLKTATAVPDYEVTDLDGIPDNFSGPSLVKKDYIFTTVDCQPGKSTYLIVTPTAGVALYTPQIQPNVGTPLIDGNVLVGQYFPDASEIFPGCGTSDEIVSNSVNVAEGRLISMAAELNCRTNAFNQYGSVVAYKTPLRRRMSPVQRAAVTPTGLLQIVGAYPLSQVLLDSQSYVEPVREGAYTVSMNRNEEFDWFAVVDDLNTDSEVRATMNGPETLSFAGAAPIFDNNFDTIVYRIDVPAGTTAQSFVLKLWKTWEFQPSFTSLLSKFASLSPEPDPAALALYREMARQLPVSVSDKENPEFWNKIVHLVNQASNVLKVLPGPVGTVAKGVHAVAQVLERPQQRTTQRRVAQPRPKQQPVRRRRAAQPKRRRRRAR